MNADAYEAISSLLLVDAKLCMLPFFAIAAQKVVCLRIKDWFLVNVKKICFVSWCSSSAQTSELRFNETLVVTAMVNLIADDWLIMYRALCCNQLCRPCPLRTETPVCDPITSLRSYYVDEVLSPHKFKFLWSSIEYTQLKS